jgi:hypothetical protein
VVIKPNGDADLTHPQPGGELTAIVNVAIQHLPLVPNDIIVDMSDEDKADVKSGAISMEWLRNYAIALTGGSNERD